MKKYCIKNRLSQVAMGLVLAAVQIVSAAGALIIPSASFPYYRHDVFKSDGWKEVTSPLLFYLKANEPFRSQESGDIRATMVQVAPDGDLVTATRFGVFRSRDRGISWARQDGEGKETRGSWGTGYPECANTINFDPQNSGRYAFFFLRGNAYFTNGITWTRMKSAGDDSQFDFGSMDWTEQNPKLIAGTQHGTWNLVISRDGGVTWETQSNRITGTIEEGGSVGNSMLVVVDANTIVYNQSGLFRSTDKGVTWTKLRDGLTNTGHVGISIGDGRVFFTSQDSLWYSTDKGATWATRTMPRALKGLQVFGDWSGGKVGGLLIADENRVAYTRDAGVTWVELIGGSSGNSYPPEFEHSVDGDMYDVWTTNWVYDADRCNHQYGGRWSYDPINHIAYSTTMGGPSIFKQLPGTAPGGTPAPHPPGDTAVVLSLNPWSLAFFMVPGGSAPAAQSVAVVNAGVRTLNTVSTSIAYRAGATGWLAITSPGSGNSQSLLNTVTPGSLGEGIYTATVTVTCTNATPSRRTYPVSFAIRPVAVFSNVVITPDIDTVISTARVSFGAAARNQFDEILASQPTITWSVSGGGAIAATGIFTPSVDSGSYNVYASAIVSGVTKTDTAIICIKKPPPPEPPVKITLPNTLVTWAQGSQKWIQWQLVNSSAVTSVSLSYTINNGTTWLPIANNLTPRGELATGNYGRYTWTVPSVNSGQCLVKITDQTGVWSDLSDVTFVIGTVAVLDPLMAGARSSLTIKSGQKGITVRVPAGRTGVSITVYDLHGRVVASQIDGSGVFNTIQPGGYIVAVAFGKERILRQACVVMGK